jgi:hypothetical protein
LDEDTGHSAQSGAGCPSSRGARAPRFRKDTALAELPPEELEWINTLVETTLSKKEVTICTARPLLVLKG